MSNFSQSISFLNNEHAKKIIGLNPNTERGNNSVLNCHPRENLILYASGSYIIVRNLDDPSEANFVYRGHNTTCTCAAFSPNGYWVASADISGKVRVWSWDNPEHILKIEIQALGGAIKELAWGGESKKIAVVGDGSQFCKVFTWDTGNNVGEMIGHNKRGTTIAYKQNRPFRIMTGSEDMRTVFYKGPPFRMDHTGSDHSNFVNCCRFSPDGSKIATVGSDKKIFIYDGSTGEMTKELASGHTGSVYSCAWSPDGTRLLTGSSDKTCRLWNVESGETEVVFTFGQGNPEIGDMQVAVLWVNDYMISLSLSGNINYLDINNPDTPSRILSGHQVTMTSLVLHQETGRYFTGSYDGVVCTWDAGYPNKLRGTVPRSIQGAAHAGQIVGMGISGDSLVSIGWDDSMRFADITSLSYHTEVSTTGQPKSLATSKLSDLIIVTTTQGIFVYRNNELASSITDITWDALSVAICNDEEVAIGGSDNKVHIYSLNGNDLTETNEITYHRGAITSLAYSPDNEYLAVGDANRQINVWIRGSWEAKVKNLWSFHTTRITTLKWSPDGRHLASGSSDENIFIWDLDTPQKRIHFQFAHKGGVSALDWLDATHLISLGQDHCLVQWDIESEETK